MDFAIALTIRPASRDRVSGPCQNEAVVALSPWLSLLSTLLVTGQPREWRPAETWLLMSSTVKWSDPELEPFESANRKDKVLADLFAERGVPLAQRVVLLDGEATANATMEQLARQVKDAPAGSTFVFYFQGHGLFDDAGRYVLATADAKTTDLEGTGLDLSDLYSLLRLRTTGDRIILFADACNSGHLGALAAGLTFLGIPTVALTSADAQSESTAAWVFTEALVDGFSGRALIDGDLDGVLTLTEVAKEAESAMRHREGQPIAFARPLSALGEFVLSRTGHLDELLDGPRQAILEPRGEHFGRGDWVIAPRLEGRREVARVLGAKRLEGEPVKLRVEFEEDNARIFGWVAERKVDPVMFERWPLGIILKIEKDDTLRRAVVTESEDGLHRVRYLDEEGGEEYVAPDEIAGPEDVARDGRHVLYDDGRTLIEAVVKGFFGDEVCLRLRGGDWNQDPCVPKSKISEK